jgi:hypothetical protein
MKTRPGKCQEVEEQTITCAGPGSTSARELVRSPQRLTEMDGCFRPRWGQGNTADVPRSK